MQFMPTPEHVHFLVSRSPDISETELATIVADSYIQFKPEGTS